MISLEHAKPVHRGRILKENNRQDRLMPINNSKQVVSTLDQVVGYGNSVVVEKLKLNISNLEHENRKLKNQLEQAELSIKSYQGFWSGKALHRSPNMSTQTDGDIGNITMFNMQEQIELLNKKLLRSEKEVSKLTLQNKILLQQNNDLSLNLSNRMIENKNIVAPIETISSAQENSYQIKLNLCYSRTKEMISNIKSIINDYNVMKRSVANDLESFHRSIDVVVTDILSFLHKTHSKAKENALKDMARSENISPSHHQNHNDKREEKQKQIPTHTLSSSAAVVAYHISSPITPKKLMLSPPSLDVSYRPQGISLPLLAHNAAPNIPMDMSMHRPLVQVADKGCDPITAFPSTPILAETSSSSSSSPLGGLKMAQTRTPQKSGPSLTHVTHMTQMIQMKDQSCEPLSPLANRLAQITKSMFLSGACNNAAVADSSPLLPTAQPQQQLEQLQDTRNAKRLKSFRKRYYRSLEAMRNKIKEFKTKIAEELKTEKHTSHCKDLLRVAHFREISLENEQLKWELKYARCI